MRDSSSKAQVRAELGFKSAPEEFKVERVQASWFQKNSSSSASVECRVVEVISCDCNWLWLYEKQINPVTNLNPHLYKLHHY